MLDAAALVSRRVPGAQFVVALASRRAPAEVERVVGARAAGGAPAPPLRVAHDEARAALAAADAAAVCSGTATLEAALVGTPLVVVYKESAFNWHTLGRLIEVEHYGLVNLIAGERVAPELMQNDFNGGTLARELLALLEPERNADVRARLREATARLGEGGASLRAADAVLRFLRGVKEGGKAAAG
jgi:lipid-A-disaccharide synthase